MGSDRFNLVQMGTADREQWNNVVLASSEGTFFHTFDWSEVIKRYGEKTSSFVPRHVFVVDKRSGEIVGTLPLFLDKRHRILISLPFGDYGGPCIAPNVNKNEVLRLSFQQVTETARREADEIHLKSLPKNYSNWFRDHHFSLTPLMYTFILPIHGLAMDHLWKNFRRDTRRGIKKAEKEGLVVEEAQEKESMKEYYHVYSISMKHIGASVRPFTFFTVLWDTLSQRKLLNIFLARYQNECIAGLIFFSWKGRLHIYGNVSLPGFRNLRPNDLLYHETIRWGVERKLRVVDFGLTPLNSDSGLYQFKKRWGGSPTLLFLTSKKYGLVRTLLQRMRAFYMLDLLKDKFLEGKRSEVHK